MAPPVGIRKPPRLFLSDSKGTDEVNHDEMTLSKEWTGKTTVLTWKVDDDKLCSIPNYPLERTSKFIEGCEGSVIAARISTVLRDLDIQAEYDGEAGKAKCKTVDLVTFRVRLYSKRVDPTGVVVECQRRSGSCSSFMRCCRSILAAASGVTPKKQPPPCYRRRPVGKMQCLKGVMLPDQNEIGAKITVQRAIELLERDNRESKLLGVESIRDIADGTKSKAETAVEAARYLILDEESVGLRNHVASILIAPAKSLEQPTETSMVQDERLRRVALTSVYNAFDALVNIEEADKLRNGECISSFWSPLLNKITSDAESNAFDTRIASNALNCLSTLCEKTN